MSAHSLSPCSMLCIFAAAGRWVSAAWRSLGKDKSQPPVSHWMPSLSPYACGGNTTAHRLPVRRNLLLGTSCGAHMARTVSASAVIPAASSNGPGNEREKKQKRRQVTAQASCALPSKVIRKDYRLLQTLKQCKPRKTLKSPHNSLKGTVVNVGLPKIHIAVTL